MANTSARMSPLLLDDEEAVAIAVGLRTSAGSVACIEETSVRALTKIVAVMPPRLLRFGYTARDGEQTTGLVEPHRLVALGRRWYLVAWDVERHGWRTFRVDRLGDPTAIVRAPAGRRAHPARC